MWLMTTRADAGIANDSTGKLSGLAWSENISWIDFDSTHLYGYGVKVCKVNFRIFERFAQH